MSFTATVENGAIKLPPGIRLPNGTLVTVIPPEEPVVEKTASRKTFAERHARYIGICKDGPEDLALNHDHYLYGASKRDAS